MPNPTETIGTDETYTTIQAWEDDLANDIQHTGECKAEAFATSIFAGIVYAADTYAHLTAQSGAEHDGRAHEVSGAGNARIEHSGAAITLSLGPNFLRVSWLEIKGPGANNNQTIYFPPGVAASVNHLHHCIIHNNGAYSANFGNYGIEINVTTECSYYLYRNIVYGVSGTGSRIRGGNGVVLNNTVYKCNYNEHAALGGIYTSDEAYTITANAAFDNFTADIVGTVGTLDYNATSDTTGDNEGANGIADLTTADQFVAPTTTWADTDLLVKAGADIIDEGVDLSGDVGTYPEIDVSIDKGATRATIAGTWDIGASEYVAAGVPGSQVIMISKVLISLMWLKQGNVNRREFMRNTGLAVLGM